MSVEIKYKGNTIASASTEVTKTIKTAGKYCEADILVENTPDGGDAPVINSLSVTANGTYTAPSGVDGYSPINVNVPQGITPTGNINITDTNVTDVTNYATAQVVDADLVAENIKKDINILGIVGTFEGGGGSLPTSITKIDGGSFTVASDTQSDRYSISHNLGEIPKGAYVWSDSMFDFSQPTNYALAFALAHFTPFDFNSTSRYYGFVQCCGRGSSGAISLSSNQATTEAQQANFATTLDFHIRKSGFYFKADVTYKWLAWA